MKVNQALLDGGLSEDAKPDGPVSAEPEVLDESDKHSKLKTLILVAAMVGGFGLFVWNMTGLVNNMRLSTQGSATSIVYEMEDLQSFLNIGNDEESGTVPVSDLTEKNSSADAARDGPADSGGASETEVPADTDTAALMQERDEAKNEAAFVRQQLKNAEDMLDSSLSREAELERQVKELTSNR